MSLLNIFNLSCHFTEAILDLSILKLPAMPPQHIHPIHCLLLLPCSFHRLLYYILFICLFSVFLAHENIGYMEAKSLVCFVLWCISSVLKLPGMMA